MVDSLNGLVHDTVVCGHHQDGDVRHLGASGSHGGKRRVTGGIQEGDILPIHIDAGGADVLGDAAGLTAGDVGFADSVQNRGLTVVNMTHDHHHRIPELQGSIVVLAVVDDPFLNRNHDLPLYLGMELAGYQIGGIKIDLLVGGGHDAHHHQFFDDLCGGGLQTQSQLRYGDGVAHRDGDGLLLPLHLDTAQPFGLGFPAGMGLAVLLGFLVDLLLPHRTAVTLYPVGGLRQHIEFFIVPTHVDLRCTGIHRTPFHRRLGPGGLFRLLLRLWLRLAGTGALGLTLLSRRLLSGRLASRIGRRSGRLCGGSRRGDRFLLRLLLFRSGGEIGVEILHLMLLGEVFKHQIQFVLLQRGHALLGRVHVLTQQLDHFLAGRSKILGNLAYAVFNHHMALSSSISCRQYRPMAVANPLSSVASTPTGF